MSLYNLVFGQNSMADVLLSLIGETQASVGRFRDAWITNDGEIAIYTRNGGGNRECSHENDPKWGSPDCKHHIIQEEDDETLEVDRSEVDNYPVKYNYFIGSDKQLVGTGRRIMKDRYVCGNPNSADCACPGCVITYRLPQNPLYIRDCDDDFDCTYATIFFCIPNNAKAQIAEFMSAAPSGDERWASMFRTLEGKLEIITKQRQGNDGESPKTPPKGEVSPTK